MNTEIVYKKDGLIDLQNCYATATVLKANDLEFHFKAIDLFQGNALKIDTTNIGILLCNESVVKLNLIDWVFAISFKDRLKELSRIQCLWKLAEPQKHSVVEMSVAVSQLLPGISLYKIKNQSKTVVANVHKEVKRIRTCAKKGTVYFIATECEQYVKIGYTYSSAEERVRDLQTGNHSKLNVIHKIETKNPKKLEAYYHKHFSKHQQLGEWFCIKEGLETFLKEVIDYAKSKS